MPLTDQGPQDNRAWRRVSVNAVMLQEAAQAKDVAALRSAAASLNNSCQGCPRCTGRATLKESNRDFQFNEPRAEDHHFARWSTSIQNKYFKASCMILGPVADGPVIFPK